jgi:predicted transposase YbfD/YdcC
LSEDELKYFNPTREWAKLQSIGVVESQREIKGEKSTETRYFITSTTSVKDFSEAVRSHWGIENKLHWKLDVCFREDEQRGRKNNCAENDAILRKIALNILDKDCSKKGTKTKRLGAAWDEKYLERLVNNRVGEGG